MSFHQIFHPHNIAKKHLPFFFIFFLSSFFALFANIALAAVQVSSSSQTFDLNAGFTQLDGNVKVAMEGTQITGSHANIKMDASGSPSQAVFTNRSTLVKESSKLKQTIQADTLDMGLKSGDMNARGKVVTSINGDTGIGQVSIQSDSQVFEKEKNLMRAIGHVKVQKDDMIATSPEAIIFMGPTGSADKAVFIKGAQLSQNGQTMNGETITIKIDTGDIFAEKNTESNVDAKDNTTGKVSHIKIRSQLQELNHATGTLLANGNAVVHYDDYIAKGPKAVFYRKNEQLDKIVLSGRAQIEDTERKVLGDTIIVTVNPRQFNAQGNVNTFIKAHKQQTASSKPATTSSGSKTTKTASNGSAEPAQANAGNKAMEDELLIEQVTQEAKSR